MPECRWGFPCVGLEVFAEGELFREAESFRDFLDGEFRLQQHVFRLADPGMNHGQLLIDRPEEVAGRILEARS